MSNNQTKIILTQQIQDKGLCNVRYAKKTQKKCNNIVLIVNRDRGFTVLFAVIVSTLVLALGLGIVAITMKEIKLSGAGRDSELAFYAADSGLECAEYFDIAKSEFATSTNNPAHIMCNQQPIISTTTANGVSATSTFMMYMEYNVTPTISKPCAEVTVSKIGTSTVIDSRGYNTCELANQRRLERGYSVKY